MKCPKCGFNSFGGLESCRKCGADLGKVRESSGPAGSLRRSREPRPAPEDESSARVLPSVAGKQIQSDGRDPGEGMQGELFAAGRSGVQEPVTFSTEIGEEFSSGPAAESDFSPVPADDEGAFAQEDGPDEGCGRDMARPVPWKPRLLATGVDLLAAAALTGLFVLCGSLILAEAPGAPFGGPLLLSYLLVAAAVCFVYFTFFHYLTGQSPGKMLFGLLVECREGGSLSFSRAFLRSFGGGLCLLSLGLGFAMTLWRPDGRGWNDLLAGSHVVRFDEDSDA